MQGSNYSIAVSADPYNAMLFFSKAARLSETYGLVAAIRLEPSKSVKIKLEIDTEETLRNQEIMRRKNRQLKLEVEIDPLKNVRELIQAIISYVKSRRKKIQVLGLPGHIHLVDESGSKKEKGE